MLNNGDVFGYLTVNEKDENRKSNRHRYWLCECVCGNVKSVREDSLKRGETVSCGCIKQSKLFSDKMKECNPIQDLTGQTFGEIYVLGISENKKSKKIYWKGLCSCGSIKDYWSANLKNGNTTTCGASIHRQEQIEKHKQELLIDLTDKKFGEWTVLKWDETSSNPTRWICKCSCGEIRSIIGSTLKSGSSTSCGHGKHHNLVGLKFGHWTVLSKDKRIRPNGHMCSTYLCQCDCGAIKVVDESRLLNGTSRSCGCYNSKGNEEIASILQEINVEFTTEYSFDDLLGPNNGLLRFDFALFNKNKLVALIEYQGIQHYKDVEFGEQQRTITDKQKKEYCYKNDIPLYEIKYDENTKEALLNILNNIYANPVPSSQETV